MSVTIDVDYLELEVAKAGWDSAADMLDGSVLRIAKVDGEGLSAPVRAEVLRFAQGWHRELTVLQAAAQSNSDAFVWTGRDYEISDRAQAERIRSLLPWAEHDDAIRRA